MSVADDLDKRQPTEKALFDVIYNWLYRTSTPRKHNPIKLLNNMSWKHSCSYSACESVPCGLRIRCRELPV